MTKQRIIESADGIAITMQNAFEALTCIASGIIITNWHPCGVRLRADIAAQEELEVSTCTDMVA